MQAAQVSTDYAAPDAQFWLSWVITTTLGWFVGKWVGIIPGGLLGMPMFYMLISAAVGLMQRWVLSVHYRRHGEAVGCGDGQGGAEHHLAGDAVRERPRAVCAHGAGYAGLRLRN